MIDEEKVPLMKHSITDTSDSSGKTLDFPKSLAYQRDSIISPQVGSSTTARATSINDIGYNSLLISGRCLSIRKKIATGDKNG